MQGRGVRAEAAYGTMLEGSRSCAWHVTWPRAATIFRLQAGGQLEGSCDSIHACGPGPTLLSVCRRAIQ